MSDIISAYRYQEFGELEKLYLSLPPKQLSGIRAVIIGLVDLFNEEVTNTTNNNNIDEDQKKDVVVPIPIPITTTTTIKSEERPKKRKKKEPETTTNSNSTSTTTTNISNNNEDPRVKIRVERFRGLAIVRGKKLIVLDRATLRFKFTNTYDIEKKIKFRFPETGFINTKPKNFKIAPHSDASRYVFSLFLTRIFFNAILAIPSNLSLQKATVQMVHRYLLHISKFTTEINGRPSILLYVNNKDLMITRRN
jgi:hypothetical protein